MSGQEAGPLIIHHLQTPLSSPLSRRPMEASSEGNDTLVALGSHTDVSRQPSNKATHGAGPASTARVTLLHVEAVAAHHHRHKHPLPSLSTYRQQPRARVASCLGGAYPITRAPGPSPASGCRRHCLPPADGSRPGPYGEKRLLPWEARIQSACPAAKPWEGWI